MKKVLWVLIDNRAGSVGQARGIISQLNTAHFEVVEKKTDYTKLSGLPNFMRGKTLIGLTSESKKLFNKPWPDYVLSISRRTVPVARYIKKMNPQTKLIQLMYPGEAGLDEFELVLLPEHDKDKPFHKSFRYLIGAPHRVTRSVLAEAREKWEAAFADLPRPLTAVIVGGAIKKRPFTLDNAQQLAEKIAAFKNKTGGSILITTSRRTGKEAQDVIMNAVKDFPMYTFLWGDKAENPYLGYLASADNIIATGDSVSMASEACGTGKPVFIFEGQSWLTKKHYRFIHTLYENGYAVPLDLKYVGFKPSSVLNAAVDAAREIERI
ncbi:MAG: mitochondrial fission ELM1 family protein [Alphaproteobacteria bacterium]|nr:mitochondrial fission ELM1 family protein [Alphaproteobacteria bacterium]